MDVFGLESLDTISFISRKKKFFFLKSIFVIFFGTPSIYFKNKNAWSFFLYEIVMFCKYWLDLEYRSVISRHNNNKTELYFWHWVDWIWAEKIKFCDKISYSFLKCAKNWQNILTNQSVVGLETLKGRSLDIPGWRRL